MSDEGKVLRVTFPNGEAWEAPAVAVAEMMATAQRGADDYPEDWAERRKRWESDVTEAMDSPELLTGWVRAWCRWEHVAQHARQVVPPSKPHRRAPDYGGMWTSADLAVCDAGGET